MSRVFLILVMVGLLASCAPTPTNTPGSGQTAPVAPAPPAAPKTLVLVGREGSIPDLPGAAGRTVLSGGDFVQDYLVVRDASDAWIGHLAEALSVDKGTWKINPDGTMDTIWKLRPNVKWQDGAPFTSDDMMFTYTLYKDPDLPSRYGDALKLMKSAEAPDPQTFIVHWSAPWATANQAPALNPLPRHLLEDAYLHDKASFGDTTRYHRDFVGLGPYRIYQWDSGSQVTFERFDDYYLGHPPLDKVVLRFMSDSNTIVANLLNGSIDMSFSKDLVDTEAAIEVQRRWEGTKNQVKFVPSQRLTSIEIQYRKEFARPQAGLTDRDVREALIRAIDRTALNEAVTHGLSPIADSWVPPTSELAAPIDSVVPKYAYDPARAQQLLAQAGWTTKGSDGILVNANTGDRFETDLWNRFALQKDQAIVADNWKSVGVLANVKQLPVARDRQLEAEINGGQMMDQTLDDYTYNGRIGTANFATAANKYTGRNLGGYSNPKVDDLLSRLVVAIDPRETTNIQRDVAREIFTDVALIPLYIQVTPMLLREGVTGPVGGTYFNWNFHEWDKK
ncbi:MAG: peptide/nickel transport system substrate-binding protein [Chloroflexota bacterium]|jgi:peptide/nickel transport system substrate-binding protein|nr:peptide/nickel transport system substrate-binding protein [Chloroflexota bacterium]